MEIIISIQILDERFNGYKLRLTVVAVTTLHFRWIYVSDFDERILRLNYNIRRSEHRCDSIEVDYYYSIEHRIIMRRVHSLVASRNVR